MNRIYEVANHYKILFDWQYILKISHKKALHTIILDFRSEDFFHNVGLQYLKDIAFSKDPKKVYQEILEQKITDSKLEKSFFYEKVEDNYVNVKNRISDFFELENLLDSKNTIMKFIKNKNNNSKINAEYFLEATDGVRSFYIFIAKRKKEDVYRVVCFFFK